MIKKIVVILILLILSGCGVNKDSLISLVIDNEEIVVGYDKDINSDYIDSYKKDEDVINEITIYIKDVEDKDILINGLRVSKSIKDNLDLFGCTYFNNDNNKCYLAKKVSNKINSIVFYNNILNDDLDELDHIVISYY